jgi:hypothetical protein
MHLLNCRCIQEHLRMHLQSLGALCESPGGHGSIWKYLEVLVRATGESVRLACGFRTDLHCADVACSGTCATRMTRMLSIFIMCRLFDSMLDVIIVVVYRNLISVYSGCLNFCNRSCASLCISDVSRD